MKFRAHETFSIRKGWLNKGLKAICENPTIFVDKNINPMDVLGIGSNMVKSLRYWLLATGLTYEVRNVRGQQLTEFGKLVKQYDPYIEELGTLWMLHYNLVKGAELSTAWNYFFNQFRANEFEKDDFCNAISNWVKLHGVEVPVRSIEDDFNCIVNTYMPRYKMAPDKVEPESNMECPLSELGLMNNNGPKSRVYSKTPPVHNAIDPMIALAVILDNARGKKEIPISELLNAENNIGRVFNLNMINMLDILDSVQQTGMVRLVRTAGLDVLKVETDSTFLDCVKQYYEELF